MTEAGGAAPEPPEDKIDREDEGNRTVGNAVMLGFLFAPVATGIWLLGTMADLRKIQDCAAQGRRNCATIEVPTGRARRISLKREKRKMQRTLTAKWISGRLVAMVSLALLVAGPAAMAQTGGTGSSGTTSQPLTIPQAPVGHRQPRADQVPSEKNLSDPNNPANKEDQALDRKIKGICRGC
jgi:hypothetical protein